MECSDAVAECVGTPDQGKTVDRLCGLLQTAEGWPVAFAENKHLTQEVLADCIEGSTWVAACEYAEENAQAKASAAARTLRSLAEKLAPIVGRNLWIPA